MSSAHDGGGGEAAGLPAAASAASSRPPTKKRKRPMTAWSQTKSRLLFEMGHSTHSPAFPEAASHDAIARNIQLAVREQDEIGWVNFLRGRTSRCWGKAQGQHCQEADLASNMLSTQTFQTALINSAWQFFHSIWEHRNGILHDANININIEKMDNRIRQLCRSPSDFVRPSSLCLFEAFSLEDCINLHPSVKHAWLRTIFLAIKAKRTET